MQNRHVRLWLLPGIGFAGVALFAIIVSDGHIAGRCLVVHADDAGMCHSMNAATIECLEKGVVTSASIMPPCPGFAEFAKWAVAHPQYDYGVHLTLTSEMQQFRWGPLLPASDVPTLVREDGSFWLTSRQVAQHASREHVEMELRAQIDKALAAGIQVTHLDNHMYSLLGREDLIDLYVQLGIEYDLPVRFRDIDTMPLKQRAEFHGGLLDAYRKAGQRLVDNGMPLFTYAESDNYDASPDEKRNHFINAVRSLPQGVSEFVIHCGYQDVDGPLPPHVSRRVEDSRVFQSREMQTAINRLGIRLLDWKEFRQQVGNPGNHPASASSQ